jgi:hypothetical protein
MADKISGAAGYEAVAKLSTVECWALLEGTRMGRLALLDDSGGPELIPVNFTSHEGLLYIRTVDDPRLRHIEVQPHVAFLVDGNEGETHWSVLVRGDAAQVTADDEIRRSGVRQLTTATPTPRPFFIRIEPSTITGRRFREGGDPGQPARPGTGPIDWSATGHRATRPNPIPHLPPFEE